MHKLTGCKSGCVYAQQKNRVYQIIASHYEGICTHTLAEWAGISISDVENLTEDLNVEEKVHFQERTGRWHLEN